MDSAGQRPVVLTLLAVILAGPAAGAPLDSDNGPPPGAKDNIGHRHHLHRHNPPHPTVSPAARLHTDREGAPLELPTEDDAFFFAIFGDRTGGPANGVSILADAVRDVNLLEPDFVMTVGDLINGYNEAPRWLRQMQEFKGIMDELICPWFPVAGNHDTYYRGPVDRKPAGEHDGLYEIHFGPLWYAFEHKNCWFIVLYSDEGDPVTGEKNFRNPDCQRISPAQFAWLDQVLIQTRHADHVFCFLHHPRWRGDNYGDDWQRVHRRLVAAGNVRAVFAGHIHHMNYAERDGIEYVTLATVGAEQEGTVPAAGFLHHFNLVTVRKQQIAIASIPVGQVIDPRAITDAMQRECIAMTKQPLQIDGRIQLDQDGAGRGEVRATLTNVTSKPIDITINADTADARWRCAPDHVHGQLAPGAVAEYVFAVSRSAPSVDASFHLLHLGVHTDYLTPGARYRLPVKRSEVPIDLQLSAPAMPTVEHVLMVDGVAGYASVSSPALALPDGPLTLECWFKAERFRKRVGLVTKAETSDYGLFVSRGQPKFSVFLDHRYVTATGAANSLQTGRWYHVAGVYDGATVRLYVDGELVDEQAGQGSRRMNTLPLLIGADVDRDGVGTAHFTGAIDEVRLSTVARYTGTRFTPPRRIHPDEHTRLLLHADGTVGPWLFDDSPQRAHPRLRNGAQVLPAEIVPVQ